MTDFITQSDMDRLAKSVDNFQGFKALFQRPQDQFTEDVTAVMRMVRQKFHGSGDRLTALLADILGMKRPTQLSDTSTMHDRLKLFGFGASRSVSGIRASTPIDDDASEKEAKASTFKKAQLFRPMRQPQQRAGSAAGSRSATASVEDVGFSFSQSAPQPFDASVANASTDGLDVTIPPVGHFAYGDLSPFERMLDRLLVDSFLIQLTKTDEGNILAAEIFRNGGEQSLLQSIFLCQHALNPTLDGGKTAAMRAFFDAIKVAEDGGSSRAAVLKMRDALALVTESDLTLAGILSRTVRTLVADSTDLTELVNRHITGADEETLETFDALVQELFSKALAIGVDMDTDQSGIVPVKAANHAPSSDNASSHVRIKCPRCGTMQKYGHGDRNGVPGDTCGTKQERNEDGTVKYPEVALPKSTVGSKIDMNEKPFTYKQGDPYYSNCKNYTPRKSANNAKSTNNAAAAPASNVSNDADDVAAMKRYLAEYGLADTKSAFFAKALSCTDLCKKAQVCNHEGAYDSACTVCTMGAASHAANLVVCMQEEEIAARADATGESGFDFRAEANIMYQALPTRQQPVVQTTEDRKQLRDDAMKSYDVAPADIRDVLKAQTDGLALTAEGKAIIDKFNAAMHAVDTVIKCIPCSYAHWRKQAVQKQSSPRAVKTAAATGKKSLCLDTGASNTIVVPGTISDLNTTDKLMFGGFNGAGQRSKGAGPVKFNMTDTNDISATVNVQRSHEVEGADTILLCLRDIFAERIQLHAFSENEIHLKFPSGQKVEGRLSEEGILLFDYVE